MEGPSQRKLLSRQARALWAKSGGKSELNLWSALPVHMADAAETARNLWRNWLAPSVRSYVCLHTNLSDDQAESVLVWLAGIHDIGKATPSFAAKVPERAGHVREVGLTIGSQVESIPHSFASETILQQWLQKHVCDEETAACLAVVVGGHHGVYADDKELDRISKRNRLYPNRCLGDEAWNTAQDELLSWVFEKSGVRESRVVLNELHFPPTVQVLFTGLVIMADWIASNAGLYPLEDKNVSWDQSVQRAREAWRQLHMPTPLQVISSPSDNDVFFHERFPDLPPGADPSPMQDAVMTLARSMRDPGLVIVEDQTGSGKTEAAYLAAEIMMQKFGCSGVAFLLPTQATSNAMFRRAESWLRSLLSFQDDGCQQDVHLLHGKAEFNTDYMELPVWNAAWMGDGPADDESIVVNQWFSGRKRGLLAPFVVGTVDQLLMAALNTRHLQLRHLGLAGKVVVVDEVHAYDAYMNEYLKQVLRFLGSYNVPALLLSATLPPTRRDELLRAYRGEIQRRRRRRVAFAKPPRLATGVPAYPLLSYTGMNKGIPPEYSPVNSNACTKQITLSLISDEDDTLVAELKEALREGGCACVIRDTVRRAQETFELLQEQLDVDVLLAHSRFISPDRAETDRMLGDLLGPQTCKRPEALVVVATQVIEQSLDVDFDFMCTDIAPVDLVIQRVGRLHRHKRGEEERLRPSPLQAPRCLITGVASNIGETPEFATGIKSVYQPSVLMRTLAALEPYIEHGKFLKIPDDVATLVECVYEQTVEMPGEWSQQYDLAVERERRDLERKRLSADQWLLPNVPTCYVRGWMSRGDPEAEGVRGRAAVRDTEESIEVVVVRETERGLELLPWVADQMGLDPLLGTGAEEPPDEQARAAALCTVNLPPALCAPYVVDEVINTLETRGTYRGWQESRWLRGALPLVLNDRREVVIACHERSFCLHYDRRLGLRLK